MKRIGLLPEQKGFFEKAGFIEFEGFLSEEELQSFRKALQKKPEAVCDALFPLAQSKRMAHLASDLSSTQILRLGAWHPFCACPLARANLETLLSVHPVCITLLIGIEDGKERPIHPWLPLPKKAGNILFVAPDKEWISSMVTEEDAKKCVLIAYTGMEARYMHRPYDPYTNECKRFNCGFGDALQEPWHPIVVK